MTVPSPARGLAFAALGFGYGSLLAFCAAMSTAGGHDYIMCAVFTSPLLLLDVRAAIFGTSLVWTLIGFLLGTLNSLASRYVLVVVMAVHYAAIPLLLTTTVGTTSEWKLLTSAFRHRPEGVGTYLLVYVAGHVGVWWLFVRSVRKRA
ncbi:MAG: hypothetical protein ACYTG0_18485 [Planctomycetota bacterium]|jgi:hypothetical protein